MTVAQKILVAARRLSNVLATRSIALAIGLTAVSLFFISTIFLLDHRSLWLDEFYTILLAAPDLPAFKAFTQSIATDLQPPAYLTLMHFWIQLFGDSAAALRSANLWGFAIIAIAMAYSWRMAWPKSVWLVFWCLVLSGRFAWDFATIARSYFLMFSASALLSILSFDLAGKIKTRAPLGKLTIAGFAATAFFACSLHYFGFLFAGSLIAALFGYSLVERQYRHVALFGAMGAIALAGIAAWIAYAYPKTWFSAQNFWLTFQPIRETRQFVTFSFSNNLVVLGLTAVAFALSYRKILDDRPLLMLIAALTLGYAAVFAISFEQVLLFHRYLSAFTPLLLLIATLVVFHGIPRLAPVVVLASVLAISLPVAVLKNVAQFEDWKSAKNYIEENYGERCKTARIMVTQFGGRDAVVSYYANGRDWVGLPLDQSGADMALASPCPVIAWQGHLSREQLDKQLATVDLHGQSIEVIAFPGVFLVVRSPN